VLTSKGKYGLKAMVHLAGTERGKPVLVADIASENNIPKKFLDAILGELRVAGLVQSKKGKGGGYSLALSPEEIRIGQIIRALDGPLAPIGCASQNFFEPCSDCDVDACEVRTLMVEVRDAIAQILDHRSLAELHATRALDLTDRAARVGAKSAKRSPARR
jgi:Rrf2 family protein